ncbi:guanylate cyclase soluble subunit alpha-2-like, partial [Carlito syrichta]|uniref:guanylate cyclase n=1 Tax=Carlito syrichta TaxID=1868482 RepID=A0A3Q0DLL9_CARSF
MAEFHTLRTIDLSLLRKRSGQGNVADIQMLDNSKLPLHRSTEELNGSCVTFSYNLWQNLDIITILRNSSFSTVPVCQFSEWKLKIWDWSLAKSSGLHIVTLEVIANMLKIDKLSVRERNKYKDNGELGNKLYKKNQKNPQTIQQTLKRTLQYYEHQVIGYRDAEKNFHNISNRCSYADHSNKEEIEDVSGILQCTANILGLKFEEIQERFGEEFFNICFDENERVLRAVGGTLQDFFNGFDALLEHIRTSFGKQATLESPSFLCKELPEGTLMLHYFHPHHIVGFAMLGMIKAAGKKIYRLDVEVEQVANEKLCSDGSNPGNCSCLTFLIKECENTNITKNLPRGTSHVPADLRISINTFCRAFPFHLMFDPNMSVLQLGEGLRKQLRCDAHKVLKFEDCFEIVSPKVNATFERVLLRLSTPFVIRTKPEASGTENQDK